MVLLADRISFALKKKTQLNRLPSPYGQNVLLDACLLEYWPAFCYLLVFRLEFYRKLAPEVFFRKIKTQKYCLHCVKLNSNLIWDVAYLNHLDLVMTLGLT